MNLSALLSVLLPALKPLLADFVEGVVKPQLQKYESQIGSAELQSLLVGLTSSAEAWVEAEIAKL